MWLRILCVHIETSSLWAEFVNKNRCISVRIWGELKHLILIILIIHIIVSYDQNISQIIFVKMDSMSGCDTSVLCLLFRPKTVHCSTKNAYTSEITFLALVPCPPPCILFVLKAYVSNFCHFSFYHKGQSTHT